jgi:hypothetical protein
VKEQWSNHCNAVEAGIDPAPPASHDVIIYKAIEAERLSRIMSHGNVFDRRSLAQDSDDGMEDDGGGSGGGGGGYGSGYGGGGGFGGGGGSGFGSGGYGSGGYQPKGGRNNSAHSHHDCQCHDTFDPTCMCDRCYEAFPMGPAGRWKHSWRKACISGEPNPNSVKNWESKQRKKTQRAQQEKLRKGAAASSAQGQHLNPHIMGSPLYDQYSKSFIADLKARAGAGAGKRTKADTDSTPKKTKKATR